MTITEQYKHLIHLLQKLYSEGEAQQIAGWVFENLTQKKLWEIRNSTQLLTATQSVLLKKQEAELLSHKPVQYVLEEAWFYKLKFYVDKRVLIPRPETEELVNWVLSDHKAHTKKLSILDIGTGSGCIPVALKKEWAEASIYALDKEEDALEVARKNAAFHKTDIDFRQLDFLDEVSWKALDQYSIIISNPPYIPQQEKALLDKNVKDFEPEAALFVEDNNPLLFYEKIAEFGISHLLRDGAIYVEIHQKFAEEAEKVFKNKGYDTFLRRDIYGNSRMIKASFY